jgi:hypothetical protein
MIEPGTYTGKVEAVRVGESEQKGTPFFELKFKIIGGPCDGWDISQRWYLSDAAVERSLQVLETCGWTGTRIDAFLDGKLHGVDSREVSLVIEHQEYEGKTNARVKWVNSTRQMSENMSKSSAASLADKIEARVLALRAKKGGGDGNDSGTPF